MSKRKIVIPHEHGGWAMVSAPFLIGMMVGSPQWMHAVLFIAWFFLYLTSYPLLQAFKKKGKRKTLLYWSAGYGAVALLFLIPSILYMPKLLSFALPIAFLLLINIWHAKQKKERAFINDICAIITFSLSGAAAYLIGGGVFDRWMVLIVLLNLLYFTGTAFFVKSIFRERTNKRWLWYTRIYHTVLLVIPWLIGYPLLALPFIFPFLRVLIYGGRAVIPKKAGVLEIIGVTQFSVLTIYLLLAIQ